MNFMVINIIIIIITVLQGLDIGTLMMIWRVNIKECRLCLYVTKLYFAVKYQYEYVNVYIYICQYEFTYIFKSVCI
jgi:hypothetical protein